MSNLFTLDNIEHFTEKINIDELYERKQQQDLKQLELFNKLLNRVHVKIKTTSRQKTNERFCWFLVPETILGVPKYDQPECIAYLMSKLKDNGFMIRYIDPNVLFISWAHWVPQYIRTEIKKKTGIKINEYGEKIEEQNEEDRDQDIISNPNDYLLKQNDTYNKQNEASGQTNKTSKKDYTSIKSYKPSGNLIYDDNLLNHLENKLL